MHAARSAALMAALLSHGTGTARADDAPLVGRLNGEAITATALAPDILEQMAGTEQAAGALEQLIQEAVVDQEARRRGLRISADDVTRRLEDLEARIRESTGGEQGLTSYLDAQAMTLEQFRKILRQALAAERMIQEDFRLPKGQTVPVEKQNVWFVEKKAHLGVRTKDLPDGVVAEVGGERIRESRLANILFLAMNREQQQKLFDDVVVIRLLQQRGAELGIEITAQDVGEEEHRLDVELRQKLKEKGVPFQGVRWRDLKAQGGVDVRKLLDSARFRANILQRKIADQVFGSEGYRTFFEDNAEYFHDHHGPRVRLRTLFLRAAKEPDETTPRDHAAALQELADLAARVNESEEPAETFQHLARIYSDHKSRDQGGDLGFVSLAQLDQAEIPRDQVGTEAGRLVGPLQAEHGAHLLWVTEFQDAPTFEELLPEVQWEARRRVTRLLKDGAHIEFLR